MSKYEKSSIMQGENLNGTIKSMPNDVKMEQCILSCIIEGSEELKNKLLTALKSEDFYNEARNQANCLAGYVSRFAKGDDIIMFMRDKEQPDVSLVTIEIIGDTITQALRRSNHYPLFEQVQALKKFAKKFKLKYKEPEV